MNENTISFQEQTEQLLIETERLREQNKVLVSELNANTQQVDALQKENKELSQELTTVLNSDVFQAKELVILDQQSETLQSQVLQDKKTIEALLGKNSELQRKNNELQKNNEDYQVMVDELQNQEITLSSRLRQKSRNVEELESNYNLLDEKFLNQTLLAKNQSLIAQGLKSELNDVKIQEERLLTDPKHGHRISNSNFKTLHVCPETLFSPESTSRYAYESYTARDTPMYGDGAFHDLLDIEEENSIYGYDHDAIVNSVRDRLQIEFENKFDKEKFKLIEKHQLEVSVLETEIIEYKKALITQGNELKEFTMVGTNTRNRNRGAMCCQEQLQFRDWWRK